MYNINWNFEPNVLKKEESAAFCSSNSVKLFYVNADQQTGIK